MIVDSTFDRILIAIIAAGIALGYFGRERRGVTMMLLLGVLAWLFPITGIALIAFVLVLTIMSGLCPTRSPNSPVPSSPCTHLSDHARNGNVIDAEFTVKECRRG